MSDLDRLQQDLILSYQEEVGVQAKIVSSFPSSIQGEIGADWLKDGHLAFGGFVNYAKTYGKIHYADYSGETYYKLILNRIAIGGKVTYAFNANVEIYMKAGVSRTSLDLDYIMDIDNWGRDASSASFTGMGFCIEPGFAYRVHIKRFSLAATVGYEVNTAGKTTYDKDEDYWLQTRSGSDVEIDWSGLRAGLGVGIFIGRINKD